MEPQPARLPDRLLLPLAFDPALLRRDLDGLSQVEWVDHFVSQNYRGDWSVIPLRAKAGATHPVMMIASDPSARAFEDTPLLAGCPYFRQVLAAFACPLLTVRLMRLGPGSTILEHRDHDLAFEDGAVRIHIPVVTNRDVDFRLNGRRVDMAPGSAWYLRLADPHSVANRGATSRVHLVIDAVADAWVADLLARAMGVPGDAAGAPRNAAGSEALDRFRALVLADPALGERLRAPDDPEQFVALVVETAAGRGLIVGAEEVRAAMRETARALFARSIVA